MSDYERQLSPNRSTALELREELQLIQEGYSMLDEKRMLLALDMLRRLKRYDEQRATFDTLVTHARDALLAAAGRHGLDGIEVYPPPRDVRFELRLAMRRSVGVETLTAELGTQTTESTAKVVNPSPEARACAQTHVDLLVHATVLAAEAATLRRFMREYRRTERRARALEIVLMPETSAALVSVEEQLEMQEIEESVRVHEAHRMRPGDG